MTPNSEPITKEELISLLKYCEKLIPQLKEAIRLLQELEDRERAELN